jgi:hypothetical protein
MPDEYQIVVSAENNSYMAWQCQLFHSSCVSRLNQTPIFIVHQWEKDWSAGFVHITRAGGIVRSAPSYRTNAKGVSYPPRNTAGTLLEAANMNLGKTRFIVLCDPDMIFRRAPALPGTLSGESYSYLDYERADVQDAARRLGLATSLIKRQEKSLHCGVPYVIPVRDAGRLARAWLEAIDAFDSSEWDIGMYAFGLAVVKLGLRITLTNTTDTNYRPYAAMKSDIVHYCYGGRGWNKRSYWADDKAAMVWNSSARAPKGTILGELLNQIREAKNFYARTNIWQPRLK